MQEGLIRQVHSRTYFIYKIGVSKSNRGLICRGSNLPENTVLLRSGLTSTEAHGSVLFANRPLLTFNAFAASQT